jgi:hypothetical protein
VDSRTCFLLLPVMEVPVHRGDAARDPTCDMSSRAVHEGVAAVKRRFRLEGTYKGLVRRKYALTELMVVRFTNSLKRAFILCCRHARHREGRGTRSPRHHPLFRNSSLAICTRMRC